MGQVGYCETTVKTIVVDFHLQNNADIFTHLFVFDSPKGSLNTFMTCNNLKVGSYDPILVQLSFQIFLCMMKNVGVHTIKFFHPIIS